MKQIILIFTLIGFSVSSHAQTYTVAYNTVTTIEATSLRNTSVSSNFLKEIISQEDFKYRKYLKNSKDSERSYKIGHENYTKTELVKLLRKTAKRSGSTTEFKEILVRKNPSFRNYFSTSEVGILYEKFQEGTFNKYIQNLADNWYD